MTEFKNRSQLDCVKEIERLEAERDALAARVQEMRDAFALIKGGSENFKGGWSGTIQACDRCLDTPDTSAKILARMKADVCMEAADVCRHDAGYYADYSVEFNACLECEKSLRSKADELLKEPEKTQ